MPSLENVTVYPLEEPGIIAGIKERDIKSIQKNDLMLQKAYNINRSVLEAINKAAILEIERQKLEEEKEEG